MNQHLLAFKIPEIFSEMDWQEHRNHINTLIVYILTQTALDKTQILDITNQVQSPVKKAFVSTYDKLIEEGRQEGRQEEKRDVVLQGLKNGLSPELLATITGLSIESVLKIIAERRISS